MCYKCRQWGKHRANECKYTAAQIAALPPMNPNKPPSGTPYDSYYNLPLSGGPVGSLGASGGSPSPDSKN